MNTLRTNYCVSELCEALDVSRSGYYAWSNRRPSARQLENNRVVETIKHLREDDPQLRVYGSPRMVHELRERGLDCSENRVARLMRKEGITARKKRPFRPRTTKVDGKLERIAPNHVADCPEPRTPGEILVSDITYVATAEGWLYLAVIIDLYTRMVTGWRLQECMDASIITKAIKRTPKMFYWAGGFFHSDRGSQYTSDLVVDTLATRNMTRSMSAQGYCYDNAFAESFFATLKTESFPSNGVFDSKASARKRIFEYIESFYNTRRRHSSLGYQSPLERLNHYLTKAQTNISIVN